MFNKIKDWFKKTFTTPKVEAPKATQQRIATPAYKPQAQSQVQTPSFQPKTLTIDATKTDLKPAPAPKVVKPVEQIAKPNIIQKIMGQGMSDQQKRNEEAIKTVMAENKAEKENRSTGRKIVDRTPLGAVLNLGKGVEDLTLLSEMLQNRLKSDGNSLAPSAFEQKVAAPVTNWAQADEYVGLQDAAKNIDNPILNILAQGGGWAVDNTLGKATRGTAGLINQADFASDGTDTTKADLNKSLQYGGEALQGWGNILLMGEATAAKNAALAAGATKREAVKAGAKYLLGRAGKAYGTGATMGGAMQTLENILGTRQGFDLGEINQSGMRALSNTGAYEITDKALDGVLKYGAKMVSKLGAKNVPKIMQALIEDNTMTYISSQGGHLLTKEGIAALGRMIGMGMARGLAEVPIESLVDPALYVDMESDQSYGERVAEQIPQNLVGNVAFGGVRGLTPGFKNTGEVLDTINKVNPNIKLNMGIPGTKTLTDILDPEIRGYAKDLEDIDKMLIEAGQDAGIANLTDAELQKVMAEERQAWKEQESAEIIDDTKTDLQKILNQEKVVDDTKTDLKQTLEEVQPEVREQLREGREGLEQLLQQNKVSAENDISAKTADFKTQLDEVDSNINMLSGYYKNYDLYKKAFPTTMRKGELRSELSSLKKQKAELQSQIDATTKGIIQQEQSLNKPLADILAAGETKTLPAPEQNVTLAGLNRLVKQGDNLENVTFTPKNADEMREALKLGLPSSKIVMPETSTSNKEVIYNSPDKGNFATKADLDRYNYRVDVNNAVNKYELDPQKEWKDSELNLAQKVAGEANWVAKRSGKVGQEMYYLHRQQVDAKDKAVGNYKALLMPLVKGVSDDEFDNFDLYLTGVKTPETPAGAEVADMLKNNIFNDIYAQAADGNIKNLAGFVAGGEDGKGSYFPYMLKKDTKLVDEYGTSIVNARHDLGNLVKERGDDIDRSKMDTSITAVFRYIEYAMDNITKNQYFGAGNSKLQLLAQKATVNKKELARIANLYGGDIKEVSGFERALRNFSTTKINPVTALCNLFQTINTANATSWGNMFKTAYTSIKNPEQALEMTIRANEISAENALPIRQDIKNGNFLGAYLKTIGFTKGEQLNHILAVNGGIKFAQDALPKARAGDEAAIRDLKRLGITDLSKDYSVEDLAITAGKRLSEITQFRNEGGGLPAWMRTSGWGRAFSQLRTFGYKQTKFMFGDNFKRVVTETSKGNFKPLMTNLASFGVAAPLIGEIVRGARELFTNKKRRDETGVERYLNNIAAVYSFGILDDVGALSGEYGGENAFRTLIGVNGALLMDIKDIGSGIIDGLGEYDSEKGFVDNILPDKQKRQLLRHIPVVGNTLANTFVDNAAVDNIYGGVNEGLAKDKKAVYNDLLSMGDTTAAEKYKAENQYLDGLEENKKGSFFEQMFGSKKDNVSTDVPTTKEEKKKIKTAMLAGGTPTKEQISATFFDNYNAESESVKERKEVYSNLRTLMNSEDYTDEQKQAVLAASGASQENWDYYDMAAYDGETKLQDFIIPQISQMESLGDVYDFLYQNRKEIGNEKILDNTMLEYLADRGYIPRDMAKQLKKVFYDEIKQEFWEEQASGSGYGSGNSTANKLAKASFQGYQDLAKIMAGAAKGGGGFSNSPVNYSQYAGLTQGVQVPNEVYKAQDRLAQILGNTRQKQDKREKITI